jgi:hypothetical protein
VNRPKYEFTGYEDITHVELGVGFVKIVILSNTDSATHVFQLSKAHALSMVELISGYRRMLEAYDMGLPKTFVYPVKPWHPHPALYSKPVKRKKLMHQNSRAEVFKSHYLRLCKENKKDPHMPLVQALDFAIDTDTPLEQLSVGNLRYGRAELGLLFEAMNAAKTYQFVDDEDFIENMRLRWLDLSGSNLQEKGIFSDLEKHFDNIAKHPYEIKVRKRAIWRIFMIYLFPPRVLR